MKRFDLSRRNFIWCHLELAGQMFLLDEPTAVMQLTVLIHSFIDLLFIH